MASLIQPILPPPANGVKWRTKRLMKPARQAAPLLVGGTGLYFRALLGGLAVIPSIPDDVRVSAQKLYDKIGEEKFRAELATLDPTSAAKLARNDRQRLIRAYEVALHTGRPLGEWHKQGNGMPAFAGMTKENTTLHNNVLPAKAGIPFVYETHLLMPPREELYAKCDARFHTMMEAGALDEARVFLKRNLDANLPVMKTIGVRELGAYLKGETTLDEAISKAQQMTRNYAKRQMTWFRNQSFGY